MEARLLPVLLALASALAACSGGGGGDSAAVPASTPHGSVPGTPVVLHGRWLAYMADEATTGPGGTDLDGNGSALDLVPVVVDVSSGATRVVGVQAESLAMISNASGVHLYTVTDEALGLVDWSGDGFLDDLVLLHTNVNLASPLAFVATLDPAAAIPVLAVGSRLFFVEDAPMLAPPETSLLYVDTAAPEAPVRVLNADPVQTLQPRIMGADEGLVFLALDETVEGRPLNLNVFPGDPDAVDTTVLGLLDGTDPAALVLTVPHALRDDAAPVRALNDGPGEWIVAFLVDETFDADNVSAPPGGVNLNTPALFAVGWWPPQCQAPVCTGCNDVDTLDQVLHWLDFAAFSADPIGDPPVNTGLVGGDRILALASGSRFFLGTLSDEADEGLCPLNADGDQADVVLRWVEADETALPSPLANASATGVGGGTLGNTDLSGRFIGVISEAGDGVDHDGDGNIDRDLVAWLDPAGASPAWVFDHSNPGTPPIESVATDWMAELPDRLRTLVAFPESFSPLGDVNGDGDTTDTVPTFVEFDGGELDFVGPPVAVVAGNPGIEVAAGIGFYRVDEADDGTDWNGDGDTNDAVLCRTDPLEFTQNTFVATLNALPGPAVFRPDPAFVQVAVAFLADESMDGVDHNLDGDTTDLVLRYVRID